MSVTGSPDGDPTKAGVAIVDVVTGLHAAVGILAALRHRDVSGEGQRVEVNLLSSALSALANQSGAFASAGVVPQRLGNDHPSIYPYGPFPTADGHIVIAVGNDGQFARLRTALGVAADPRFARARERTLQRDALRPVLEDSARRTPGTRVVRHPHRSRGALRADPRRRRGVRVGGRARARPGRVGRRRRRADAGGSASDHVLGHARRVSARPARTGRGSGLAPEPAERGRARVIAHPGPLSARAPQCYFFLLTVRS